MISGHLNLKKNVVSALVSVTVNIGLVFVSYRLLILEGGVTAVGLWSMLFAWTTLIRVGDVGMANATMRFAALHDLASDPRTVRAYVETGIIANSALFAVLSVIGYVVLDSLLDRVVEPAHLAEAHQVLPVMFGGFLAMNVANSLSGSIQGLHLGYIGYRLSVIGNVVQIAAVLALVPSFGLVGMAWSQVIQYTILTVASWVVVRRTVMSPNYLPVLFDRAALRAMLGFSLKAQVANVTNGLFEPVSKILVSHFGGLHAQGLYELAFKSLFLPRTAIVSGVTAMIPTLTHLLQNEPDRVGPLYRTSVRYSTGAVLAVSIAIIAASPVISWIWIGHVERDYTLFIALLAGGIVLNAFGAAAYNLAVVTGRLRNNVIVNTAMLGSLIVSGLVVGTLLPLPALVGTIAVCLGLGGLAIKIRNERFLKNG